MVDLNNVKSGDTLVVEIEVISWDDPGIYLKTGVVRHSHGAVNSQVKVLDHKPKPIDEPMGIGAVVRGTWHQEYTFVRTGNSPNRPWEVVLSTPSINGADYPFRALVANCPDLKVLSEGYVN